jgi:hypothetical protein
VISLVHLLNSGPGWQLAGEGGLTWELVPEEVVVYDLPPPPEEPEEPEEREPEEPELAEEEPLEEGIFLGSGSREGGLRTGDLDA